ncbi:MAG: UDP-N-acetylglucosamine acyltransferase [Pseudonocardia sp.]|nr:UDP-N-acetylglucosamine acyltransferase [Pseudonocardia sp.]
MAIHPSAVITEHVQLGTGVVIGPNAVLLGPCLIGDGVRIGAGCVIGSPPEIVSAEQNAAWNGEFAHHGVEIGAGTVVRELTSIQQGSTSPTVIGANCWLLSRTYVAHDCVVGDRATMSAGVSLAGFVRIGPDVTLGMATTVHQRRSVGRGAIVGMSAAVVQDVPAFAKAYGVPARLQGANVIGMTRQGIAEVDAKELDEAYRAGTTEEAGAILARLVPRPEAGGAQPV